MPAISAQHLKILLLLFCLFAVAVSGKSMVNFVHTLSVADDESRVASEETPQKVNTALPDINTVSQSGWFGLTPEDQTAKTSDVNLGSQFELKGVSRSADNKLQGAFIAEKGTPEVYYHIGDELPENAGTLAEIFPDHVTVKRGQIYFPLRFSGQNSDTQDSTP